MRPKAAFSGQPERNYNLKNKQPRKFLQWEKQTFGINLGWTDDAEPATAKPQRTTLDARLGRELQHVQRDAPDHTIQRHDHPSTGSRPGTHPRA